MSVETRSERPTLGQRFRRAIGRSGTQREVHTSAETPGVKQLDVPSFHGNPDYNLQIITGHGRVDKSGLIPDAPNKTIIVEESDPTDSDKVSYVYVPYQRIPEDGVQAAECFAISQTAQKGLTINRWTLGAALRGPDSEQDMAFIGPSRRILYITALESQDESSATAEIENFEWAKKIAALHHIVDEVSGPRDETPELTSA